MHVFVCIIRLLCCTSSIPCVVCTNCWLSPFSLSSILGSKPLHSHRVEKGREQWSRGEERERRRRREDRREEEQRQERREDYRDDGGRRRERAGERRGERVAFERRKDREDMTREPPHSPTEHKTGDWVIQDLVITFHIYLLILWFSLNHILYFGLPMKFHLYII